jgi:hypothetical protein
MKLLTQKEAKSKKKQENDALVDSNVRLRKYHSEIITKLNNVKDNYDTDKLQKLEEFEKFCKDIEIKRTKLLEELANWQKLVADTKETYYTFISKMDALEEKEYEIQEENNKLNLREAFVLDLEEKWRNKQ